MARIIVIALTVIAGAASAQDAGESAGYVLAPGEGESLGPGRIIMASPRTGTQGGVLMFSSSPARFKTSFHIHQIADEFFYIISGNGAAEFGGESHSIGPGYFIFVPAGGEHKLSVTDNEPMEVLSFFDQPGFDDWFREAHERFFSKSLPLTLEDCNEIGAKYNHVCVRD